MYIYIYIYICSELVKNVVFCAPMYSALSCIYLRSSNNKIRVACNNAFRSLHGIARYVSTRLCQVYANIPTFDAHMRNSVYGFYRRIEYCLKT